MVKIQVIFLSFFLYNNVNARTTLPDKTTSMPSSAATIDLQTSRPFTSTLAPIEENSPIAPNNNDKPEQSTISAIQKKFDENEIKNTCGTVVVQPTKEGEFPWHAPIFYVKGDDRSYICGSSLISRTHVLTVAHCVTKRKSEAPLTSDYLVVYLGKYYVEGFSSVGIQNHTVSDIIPHPQYNAESLSNDIALVKLAIPAEITDYVRPICLWRDAADWRLVQNKQGSVIGWGFDESTKMTKQLIQTKMSFVPQQTCMSSITEFSEQIKSDNTYCARFTNGTSVCNGDSGSSMVFPKFHSRSNPVWQLRGLISVGVALQKDFKCDSTQYAIFTDVAEYLAWIKESVT